MKDVISTNLRENGILEIYLGSRILAEISNGKNDETFVSDVLFGMGYVWNEDGTISEL